MSAGIFDLCSMSLASPFLAILAIHFYYQLRRCAWKRKKRKGMKNLGFCPSSIALGSVFLLMPVFYRPSVAYVIQARLQQDVEEDDQGDPEAPEKHLGRQLRRIRRGDRVETLVLKLQVGRATEPRSQR